MKIYHTIYLNNLKKCDHEKIFLFLMFSTISVLWVTRGKIQPSRTCFGSKVAKPMIILLPCNSFQNIISFFSLLKPSPSARQIISSVLTWTGNFFVKGYYKEVLRLTYFFL